MRRHRGTKRGRCLSLVAAVFVGYLFGDWHAAIQRSTGFSPSPSQNVALRFPEAMVEAAADAAADVTTGAAKTDAPKDPQLVLFSPEPMVPMVRPQPTASPPSSKNMSAQPAAAAPTPPVPAPHREPRNEGRSTATTPSRTSAKQPALESARHANRPGFLLNDAQIASIKQRLHLTPDQERMWPAVEVALRNIAHANVRGHRPGVPADIEAASLDADSAEVQGLKSAAIPLIMSFSDEQKSEVRSLAHVMGLDKLAAEF